ncbi:hypothetical protein ADL21_05150 [Streptomyces albus subsp. albus]|nr:hypothetical protein ADL21_05150 [Streptomyces albus subsp. albus]
MTGRVPSRQGSPSPSRKNAEREELRKALDYLREGDTLVVPSLDRLGRSSQDLAAIVNGPRKRGVGFASLHEALDTATPGGRPGLRPENDVPRRAGLYAAYRLTEG